MLGLSKSLKTRIYPGISCAFKKKRVVKMCTCAPKLKVAVSMLRSSQTCSSLPPPLGHPHPLQSKPTALRHSATCSNSSFLPVCRGLSRKPLILYPQMVRIRGLYHPLKQYPEREREIEERDCFQIYKERIWKVTVALAWTVENVQKHFFHYLAPLSVTHLLPAH